MIDIRDNKVVINTGGSMAVFGACAGTIMDLSPKEMDPIRTFNDLNGNESDLDTDVFPQILIRADFEPYANTIGTRPFIILKAENLEYIGILPGREAGNIFRIPRKYIKRIHNCESIKLKFPMNVWRRNLETLDSVEMDGEFHINLYANQIYSPYSGVPFEKALANMCN